MAGFIHDGHVLRVVAPHEVQQGEGLLIGNLFGIAREWSEAGQTLDLLTWGVFEVRKPRDEQWAVGQNVLWDQQRRTFSVSTTTGVNVGFATRESTSGGYEFGEIKISGFVLQV